MSNGGYLLLKNPRAFTPRSVKNQTTAKELDNKHPIFPGGSGEHDFYLDRPMAETVERLDNYAEYCGGLSLVRGFSIELHTCDCGVFIIYFRGDRSRVTRIDRIVRGVAVPYWDERKVRLLDYSCQSSNAHLELLED